MAVKREQKKIPSRNLTKKLKTTTRNTQKSGTGIKREVINHEEQRNTNDNP